MRVQHQPAYVLLNRSYSETSWIVELYTRDYGRLALIAKGARRLKSKLKGILLPFQPLLISWSGKGEVPTLTSAEITPSEINFFTDELTGDALVCGFYCNELISRFLHRYDPHQKLFEHYHQTVLSLYKSNTAQANALNSVLRDFELKVMAEIGYAVNFACEADGKTPIDESTYYEYRNGSGFVKVAANQTKAIPGSVLLGLKNNNADHQGKQLMRDILSQNMGHRSVKSRELFYPKAKPVQSMSK